MIRRYPLADRGELFQAPRSAGFIAGRDETVSTAPDSDRYAKLDLKMVCPNCGSGGMIPWKQLAQVLICRGCDKRFRVARSGLVELPPAQEDRIRLHVRTNSSEWREHKAVLVRAPRWAPGCARLRLSLPCRAGRGGQF